MYQHVRVFVYDKDNLEDAIKRSFKESLVGTFKLVIDKFGNEKFPLMDHQVKQHQHDLITLISCNRIQIPHSRISLETSQRNIICECFRGF